MHLACHRPRGRRPRRLGPGGRKGRDRPKAGLAAGSSGGAYHLGKTPAVCRASYINPRVIEHFEQGRTIAPALDSLRTDATSGSPARRGAVEEAVVRSSPGSVPEAASRT